jgi:hypothetical protein
MNTAHRLAAGLLLLAAATAQAADIRPGLWEFRSTRMSAAGMPDMSAQMAEMQKQMKNLPPKPSACSSSRWPPAACSSARTARCAAASPPNRPARTTSTPARPTAAAPWPASPGRQHRARPPQLHPAPGTADFETTIASPEHFTTRIHMRGAQGDMQADTDARWVAAQCAAPARPSPEAR